MNLCEDEAKMAVCAANILRDGQIVNGCGGFYIRDSGFQLELMYSERVLLTCRASKLNRTTLPVLIERLNQSNK